MSDLQPLPGGEGRVAFGERIVATLSRQLTPCYGKGFTKSALNRLVRFAEVFPDERIVHALRAQLSDDALVKQLVSLLRWANAALAAYGKPIPATLSPELVLCCDGDGREFGE